MKKHPLIFILLFFPISLFAQDITGLWKGRIYDDTTHQYIPYEIAVSEGNGKLTGYSYAIFKGDKGDEIGLKTIKLKRKGNNNIELEDVDWIANTYSVQPSKKVKKLMELTFTMKDSIMVLAGSWTTNWTKQYHPVTGTVELERKNEYWREPLIKKLDTMQLVQRLSFVQPEKLDETISSNSLVKKDSLLSNKKPLPTETVSNHPVKEKKVTNNGTGEIINEKPVAVKVIAKPAAVEVEKRATPVIQSIAFQSDSLVLTIYDNGIVDGDTVSILLNNQLIFSKEGLSEKPVTKTIYTKNMPDSIVLIWYAENLGTIPPNTGLLILYDGKIRHEIFFSADLKTNAALVLTRQKKTDIN